MSYPILTIIPALLAIVVAYWAAKLLLDRHWLFAWIRGTCGLILLFCVAVLVFAALDIYSYKQLAGERNIATISFRALEPQRFAATFVEAGQPDENFELYGDQWQLDSRIVKWHGLASRLGLKTGYRLERLSGRYLSLTDEQTKPRSMYTLKSSHAGIDLWQWLQQSGSLAIVDARYGNSTYLPMVDGGQYQVTVSASGLLARPLNPPAKAAVELWR